MAKPMFFYAGVYDSSADAEQDYEAILVRVAEVRPLSLRLERQITDLAALVGGKAIPVLPPLRREPDDRR